MRVLVLLGAGLATATTAFAHHGFGTFMMNEDIELTGTVTGLDFVNPHSWLHIEVTKEDGTVENWRCELRSATTLRRSGWSPDMFPNGMTITIEGIPDRTDDRACYTSTLIFPDGSSLDRYAQRIEAEVEVTRPLRLANGKPNLGGDWAVEQRIMTDPKGRDGTLVPLSEAEDYGVGGVPEGQSEIPGARGTVQAERASNPEAGGAAGGGPGGGGGPPRGFRFSFLQLTDAGEAEMERLAGIPRLERSCMAGSIVSDWGGEPVNRITHGDGTITIAYGAHGRERVVDMTSTIHPAVVEPGWAGHSIGWWDGDVLVVDTVGFEPGPLTGTTPHSSELHVVERFSIDTDAMTLTREFWAEDPLYLAQTYSGSTTMIVSNVPYAAEACQDLTPQAQ